jgi:amino acid transporter
MFSVGNVGAITGNAAFISAAIALIPMMAAAFAFGELTAMIPGGG